MSAPIQFKKAVKYNAKGRACLTGPAGSGKSLTALELARQLAGPDGKIAAIDTEHGSLSKYADRYEFDVTELDSYSPEIFLQCLTAAEQGGYVVFLCDSLSHFWMGKDGALEFVDNARKRSGSRDDMSGWKDFRPHERAMVDRMIASPCHVIVTLRTKTAYEEQVNEKTGKKMRVKSGLAPVQREGLDYEFDLVGLMNDENELIIDKTRCSAYAGKVISKPKGSDFEAFDNWLKGEKRPEPQQANPNQTGGVRHSSTDGERDASPAGSGTSVKSPTPPSAGSPPDAPDVPPIVADMWKLMATEKAKGFAQVFAGFQDLFVKLEGETRGIETYNTVLGLHGVDSWQNFKSLQRARQCVLEMYRTSEELTQAASDDQLSLHTNEAA